MFSRHQAEWQSARVAKATLAGAYLRLECGRFPQTTIVTKQNPLLDPSSPGP